MSHLQFSSRAVAKVSMALFASLSAFLIYAPPMSAQTHTADEQEVRADAQAFEKAFAGGDARAIAQEWTPEGTFTDQQGNEYRGRADIEAVYADFFKQNAHPKIDLSVQSITFPSDDVAIEEGISHMGADTPTFGKYTAVHVKRDGHWLLASVVEMPYAPERASTYLSDLNWLAGNWTAQGPKQSMHLKGEWDSNHNFLYLTFSPPDKTGGTDSRQVIGWDGLSQQIGSWHFASDGGIGRGVWHKQGDDWRVRAMAVEPSGKRTAATYVIHKLDNDSFTWRAVERTLNDELLPDTKEVRVVRDTISGSN